MPLAGTNILDVEYDSFKRNLTLYFLGGGKYVYESVPYDKYAGLLESKKRGEYFNTWIKDVYKYQKIY